MGDIIIFLFGIIVGALYEKQIKRYKAKLAAAAAKNEIVKPQ